MSEFLAKALLLLGLLWIVSCTAPAVRSEPPECVWNRQNLLEKINRLRRIHDRPPMFYDRELAALAASRAASMAKNATLSHGEGPLQSLRRAGIVRRHAGENLARVQPDVVAGGLVEYWQKREREFRNLLQERYLRAGVAVRGGSEYCYAVLLLTE